MSQHYGGRTGLWNAIKPQSFRFRAWMHDERENGGRMLYPDDMIKLGWWISTDGDGVFCIDADGDAHVPYNSRFVDLKLLQSTGLADKSGKEIFEGDILSDDGVVSFHNGCFHVGLGRPGDIRDEGSGLGWDLVPYDQKVIGNIYENPELMKG